MRRGQASQGLGPSPLSRGVEEAPLKLGDMAGELTLQPEGSGGNGGGGVRTESRLRATSRPPSLADTLPWGLDLKYPTGLNLEIGGQTFLKWFHKILGIALFHSCILAWETPWTEKSGGLQSMGS